jgi:quaternary ammonium compound-resistance protein SugE
MQVTILPWLYLFIAGILEVGWIYSLKQTEGFTKVVPIVFYILTGGACAYFFSLSLKSIPVGVAYACWTGIAVVGTAFVGIAFLREPYKTVRVLYILIIIIGIIGLKLTSSD